MSGEIIIEKPYAEIEEIGNAAGSSLRIWCDMYPDVYNLQIRSENPLRGKHSNGKIRNLIATVNVTIEELQSIVDEMKKHKAGNRDSKFESNV